MKVSAVVFLFCTSAFAQTRPVFTAADIHPSAPETQTFTSFLPGGRAEFFGVTLPRLVTLAYSIPFARVSGGPAWIERDRFDIIAMASPDAKPADMRIMLQNLLTDRFGLVVRQEEKPVPIWALVVSKPGVAKPIEWKGEPQCELPVGDYMQNYSCRGMTMDGLVNALPSVTSDYFDAPLVNRTGLTGAYEFKFEYVQRGMIPPGPDASRVSLFGNLERQLGLKVEAATQPGQVATIVSANRTPTENPPGTLEKLGPRPTQFELATIKLSPPDTKKNTQVRNGRLDLQGMTLRDLVALAYNLDPAEIKVPEKWMETDLYTIQGQSTPSASGALLRSMIKPLLADRFGLKIRRDLVTADVFVMTVDKPKFQEAKPEERTSCRIAVTDGLRTLICQNITMAEYAPQIRNYANWYLDRLVVDQTGLKGSYDITVSWSPRKRSLGAVGGEGPDADQTIGLTVFEGAKQVGLKLTQKTQQIPGIVVDQAHRPAEN